MLVPALSPSSVELIFMLPLLIVSLVLPSIPSVDFVTSIDVPAPSIVILPCADMPFLYCDARVRFASSISISDVQWIEWSAEFTFILPPENLIIQSAVIPFDEVSNSTDELSPNGVLGRFCSSELCPVCDVSVGVPLVVISIVPPLMFTIELESIPSPTAVILRFPSVISKVSLTFIPSAFASIFMLPPSILRLSEHFIPLSAEVMFKVPPPFIFKLSLERIAAVSAAVETRLLSVPSSVSIYTLSAFSTYITGALDEVISTPFSFSLTLSSVEITMLASEFFPLKVYTPPFEIVSVLSLTDAPSPLTDKVDISTDTLLSFQLSSSSLSVVMLTVYVSSFQSTLYPIASLITLSGTSVLSDTSCAATSV